jgi:hypothetical protein
MESSNTNKRKREPTEEEIAKKKAYLKEWRKINALKISAKAQQWYKDNPEYRAYRKVYMKERREKQDDDTKAHEKALKKAWYENNKYDPQFIARHKVSVIKYYKKKKSQIENGPHKKKFKPQEKDEELREAVKYLYHTMFQNENESIL